MDYQSNSIIKKRISWASVIAGIFTVMAVFILLFILGSSLGISMISPKSNDIINGAGTTVLIWTLVSILLSLACGAFVTGRLAGINGMIHGFLVWATSLILSIIIGTMLISSFVSMVGHTIGTLTSTTGEIVGSVGSASGNGIKGIFNFGSDTFKKLNIDPNLNSRNLDQRVTEALKKSDIPALQPNYLSSQLNDAQKETQEAIKQIEINPNQTDAIISGLINKLKGKTQNIYQSINRTDVERAISQNTNLTPKESERAVDNIIALHQQSVQEANQKLTQLQNNIQDAKTQFNEFKIKAQEKADQAVKAIARLSFWSFIALLLGAIISTVCGLAGAKLLSREDGYPS